MDNSHTGNPSHSIRILDNKGNEVDVIPMTMYIETGTYTFDTDVSGGEWSIHPDPPEGVSFSAKDHTWSGVPPVIMPRTQFNVTVFVPSTKETVSRLFYAESVYCKEGFYIIRHIDYTSKARFTLTQGDTVLESTDVGYRIEDRYFCIPLQPVNMTFNCERSNIEFCLVSLLSTDNITYATLTPRYGASSQSIFSMKAESVPTILVDERDLVLTRGESIRVPVTVSDVHHFIDISPPLPKEFKYDHKNHVFLGIAEEKTAFLFTITAINDMGSVTKSLGIYVDDCPAGKELAGFSHSSYSSAVEMRVEDLAGNELLYMQSAGMTFRKNGCFPAGEYVAVMLTARGMAEIWDSPMAMLDSRGMKLEEFQKTQPGEFQRERFVVGDAIPRGSSMKYLVTEKVGKKWNTAKFRDSDWSEGSAGKWGSLTAGKSVYFRRSFWVSRGDGYSLIQLSVEAADKTNLFLNGREVAAITQTSEEPVIISIPAENLVDGWNLLAAQQTHRGESVGSPAIIFDVSLHLSTSRCISPVIRGDVWADTPLDKRHPPKDVFGGPTSFWRTPLPATLTLATRPERFVMPRRLSFAKAPAPDAPPREVRVLGLVIDRVTNETVEEEIAHVRSPFLLYKRESETILLRPLRAYNGIRVQFLDSSNRTSMAIGGMGFTSCQMGTCKRRWGLKEKMVGEEEFKKCPMGYYGAKRVVCGREDVTPQWKEDRSMCLSKYAAKGEAYIDTRIRVTDVREDYMHLMGLIAKSAAANHVMVQEDQVTFPYVMSFEDDTIGFEFIMRLTVEEEIGDYVEKKLLLTADAFMNELREKAKIRISYASIDMVGLPVLREPVKWIIVYVSLGVVLALIVAFAAGFFSHSLYIRSKSAASPRRKQLKRTGVENETLLDQSVSLVCYIIPFREMNPSVVSKPSLERMHPISLLAPL